MTEKRIELKQAPDDSWTIEIPTEMGLVQVMWIGKLSKEQAIRETQLRGYTNIRCWDKYVLAAITSGDAKIDPSVFQP